jgi:hypothetical protein
MTPTTLTSMATLLEFMATDPYEPTDGKTSFPESVFALAFRRDEERFEQQAAYFNALAAALREIDREANATAA